MTGCAAPCHDGQPEPTPAKPHGRLCHPCEAGLGADLRRLPALDAELGIIALTTAAPGNGTPRLPFDADVSEWRALFRRNTTRAVRDVAAERGWALPPDHPWAMCAWLIPQVRWMSVHHWVPPDWAARAADAFRKTRARGERLRNPVEVRHVFLPGACLDCGNGRMAAVIYADHRAGRWSYWACPACERVTPIEHWWDYPKRLAVVRGAATDGATSSPRAIMTP